MSLPEDVRRRIDELVHSNDVVLFMKGTRRFPQCGFSSQVVQILDGLGASYRDVNVLVDPALRDGIKAYSDWPTIPQLYVKGEFVGGCDIVKELQQNGELGALVGGAPPAAPGKPPSITLSDAAAAAVRAAAAEGEPGEMLRFAVSPSFAYDLSFGPREPGDVEVSANGVTILLDPGSATRADGTSIGFVDGPEGGFKIDNPNEPARVKQLGPEDLKAMMDAGEAFELVDVRGEKERAIASIPGAKPLTPELVEALDREVRVVFHCHHGGRSQAAAERFLAEGFKNVLNLRGGIDAWSTRVDPKVPRY
ncbi:MAG TPA: Grx4 family monothiol glutaredoxin [Minicystis sp.]|nr:Grx4 family monothiol glutaredoxin [Minicystis sp.]